MMWSHGITIEAALLGHIETARIETGNSLGEVMRPHGIAVETAYDTSHPITVVEIGAECTKEMYSAGCIFR